MSRETKTGGRDATTAVVPGRGVLSIGNPGTKLPGGFSWTPLSALARLESGHTPRRSNPEYWDGGIPWIGIRDATANHGQRIDRTFQTITELGLENSSTRLLPKDTVCLSRTASVGYVIQINKPMCTSQDFVNWVCGPKLIPDYLRYALVRESASVRQWAHGSTHQTLYFPEAKAIHISLPSLEVQQAITELLGALDEKIAANAAVSIKADNYASGLFRRFARFARSAPEPLGNYTTVVKGASYTSANLGDSDTALLTLKCFGRDGSYNPAGLKSYAGAYRNDQVVAPGDVIVAHTDLTQDAAIVGHAVAARHDSRFTKLVASLDTAIVRANPGINAEYLLWLLKSDRFRHHCRAYLNGTTVLHLHSSAVPTYQVSLPDLGDQENFGAVVRPLLALQEVVQAENVVLRRTRDELLPLLMNGRISVKDAGRAVEGVL